MTKVILLSVLGLEGETSSSLEEMPWSPPHFSTGEKKKITMVITLSFLGLEGPAMATFVTLHSGIKGRWPWSSFSSA